MAFKKGNSQEVGKQQLLMFPGATPSQPGVKLSSFMFQLEEPGDTSPLVSCTHFCDKRKLSFIFLRSRFCI
jgi:hypothetical protein